MDKEVEKIFLDIIMTEMNLPDDYGNDDDGNEIAVGLIGFNNYKLGSTDEIQIIVTNQTSKVRSNNTYTRFDTPLFKEESAINMKEEISIDIMSRNTDARERRWEIISALESLYSKDQQEKYFFKIFKIPPQLNNVSGAEGGSNINRFNVVVPCFTWYNKEKTQSVYYKEFSTRVDNEETAGEDDGLIEFTEGP